MQELNLTPQQEQQQAAEIFNLRTGLFKLLCNYSKHVEESDVHHKDHTLHPYDLLSLDEISAIEVIYVEAEMMKLFRPQ